MQVYKMDKDGWYIGVRDLSRGEPLPDDCRTDQPHGFQKAKRKFDDTGWMEGATQEELNNAVKVPPTSDVELLKDSDSFTLMELMNTQLRLEAAEKTTADLTLQLVEKGLL